VWIERLADLCPLGSTLEVKVICDAQSPGPMLETDPGPLRLSILAEKRRYRGPVGIAKDECIDLEPEALILLAEASRVPTGTLAPMIEAHHQRGSDITVGVNPDRSPAGVFLFHRSALDLAPDKGFMDLKEQWLPKALDSGLKVGVCTLSGAGLLSVRTRELFLAAARQLNGLPDPLESTLEPLIGSQHEGLIRRCVVAESSTIAQDAVVQDSVVMEHATVGAGAVVARSLVCPRCVVAPDRTVVDSVVGREGLQLSVAAAPGERSEPRR
jgi:hypothetical protein